MDISILILFTLIEFSKLYFNIKILVINSQKIIAFFSLSQLIIFVIFNSSILFTLNVQGEILFTKLLDNIKYNILNGIKYKIYFLILSWSINVILLTYQYIYTYSTTGIDIIIVILFEMYFTCIQYIRVFNKFCRSENANNF